METIKRNQLCKAQDSQRDKIIIFHKTEIIMKGK